MSDNSTNSNTFQHKLYIHRKAIVWTVISLLFVALIYKVSQLFILLLFGYGISLLLDPIVSKLEKRSIPRSLSVITVVLLFVIVVILIIAYAIPAITREYTTLVYSLPTYVASSYEAVDSFLKNWLGHGLPRKLDDLINRLRDYLSALGMEQLKAIGKAVGQTILGSYSVTASLINLLMLPFFVFYLTRDMRSVHKFLGGFLSAPVRAEVTEVGTEILDYTYLFFKGQLFVAVTLAILYMIGLSIVGLPLAIVVGLITGLLGIVPYLGFTVGLILATVITLVNDPTWFNFLLVWLVFFINNLIEVCLLTPRLVGEKLGIHPLGVLLALIIGGQLFGIIGLILAIPTAAAIRVMFRHLMEELNIS